MSYLKELIPLRIREASFDCETCNSQFYTALFGFTAGALCAYVIARKRNGQDQADRSQDVGKQIDMTWPLNSSEFRRQMRQATDIIVDYHQNTERYKVFTGNNFGSVYDILPQKMPDKGESCDQVLQDYKNIILPGLLHWQHPRFHGYFAAGCSYPDILADTLISGLSVVPFDWIASPSLAELEMTILNWFGKALGLDEAMLFAPNAQDSKGGGIMLYSSSEIIYTCLMVSRNKKLNELVKIVDHRARREEEASVLPKLVVYTNAEAHSSIEKACKMALIRLRPLQPKTRDFGLTGDILEEAIQRDIERGNIPFHVHGSLGTTNTAAMDRIDELAEVAKSYNCWFHVDAAYGGCAMICPEFRHLGKGIEKADSLNVNLHKWPFSSVPMSFFWCRHRQAVQSTFSVNPQYLEFLSKEVPAFRHWSIQLSRRAQCIKAWFVFRMFGLEGMQNQIRNLVKMSQLMRKLVEEDGRFAIVGKPVLTLFAVNVKSHSLKESNRLTKRLCEYINKSSELFVTHAKPMGIDVIRINVGRGFVYKESDIYESFKIFKKLTDDFIEKDSESSASEYRAADVVTRIEGSPMSSSKSHSPAAHSPKSKKQLQEITASDFSPVTTPRSNSPKPSPI